MAVVGLLPAPSASDVLDLGLVTAVGPDNMRRPVIQAMWLMSSAHPAGPGGEETLFTRRGVSQLLPPSHEIDA